MNRAPTLAAIRAELAEKAPGIVIRKTESGEYRVTFAQVAIAAAFPAMTRAELIEKAESLAAYESDICEAYETGKAMARVGLANTPAESALPPADHEADAGEIEPAAPAPRTIAIEMSWKGAAGIIGAALENGTGEGRRAARVELARMADLADRFAALQADLQGVAPPAPPADCGGVRVATSAGGFEIIGNGLTIGVYPHCGGQPADAGKWYLQAALPNGGEVFESRTCLPAAMADAISLAARDGKWPAHCYAPAADA